MTDYSLSRRHFLAQAGVASTAATLGWPSQAQATAARAAQPHIPTCAALREAGPLQRRDLSLPYSRIVLHPYDFNSPLTPLQQSDGPDIPLGVAFYAADQVFTMSRLLSVYERPPGPPGPGQPFVGFADDFDTLDPAWHVDAGLHARVGDGSLQLTVAADAPFSWGAVSQWLVLDLDTCYELRVTVPEAVGRWVVKVNDGTLPTDLVVKREDTRTGTVVVDLRKATSWHGTKRLRLRIFAVGREQPVTVDDVRIVAPNVWLRLPDEVESAWLPHELTTSASYRSGLRLNVSDHFHDAATFLRKVRVEDLADDDALLSLAGQYDGEASWDARNAVLTVAGERYSYAVGLPPGADPLFYASREHLLAGGPVDAGPGASGAWEMAVDPAALEDGIAYVSVAFATAAEGGPAVAARRARRALSRAATARDRQKSWWNSLLARVPHPLDFDLHGVPSYGVTAEDVRRSYYTGWVFCVANILPAQPEVDFPYPQLPAGKPSRWVYGAPKTRPTATWDSVLGMQLLAYVDPDTAWATFEGLVSLVDADGAIGGESLPTRFADTATILYHVTGDLDRLRRLYPAVKRHVLWARDNPRWIHGDHDFPDEKDAQFAFSALIDMAYMRDLAGVLDAPDEAAFWQRERERYVSLCEQWFWTTPTSDPHEFLREDTGATNPGNPLWIGAGIHVDLWADDSPYLAGLIRRLMASYRPEAAYAGMTQVKYPDLGYTSYGLLDRGRRQEATVLMNANLREVVRANSFAESYTGDPPTGDGVRPSLFGLGQLLCTVLLNNGYRFDLGWPAVVRMTDGGGGVLGLRIRGKQLDLRLTAGSSRVRLGGNFIRDGGDCGDLDVPLGATRPVPIRCATA